MLHPVVPITLLLAAIVGASEQAAAGGRAGGAGVAGAVDGNRSGADRRLVAVVKAPDADGACQEIVTRIIAELMADGTPVVALTCPATDATCMAMSGARVSAIVVVQLRDNVRAVEVRAGDAAQAGAGRHTAAVVSESGRVQRVADTGAGAPPAALAVRAVELLRAMLFEVAAGPGASASAAVPIVQQAVDVETTASAGRAAGEPEPAGPGLVGMGPNNVTVSIGAAVIGGFAGLNAVYGPMVTVGRQTSKHVLLSALLAGPAFGPDQSNIAGSVTIRHELAALQADLMGVIWRRFVVRAGIGGGFYHIHVDGRPNGLAMSSGEVTNRSTGGFAGLLSWSAGVVGYIRPDVGVFVDGRMFVLMPTPVILLNGIEVGRAGNPGLTVSAGVELKM
ncbi:MAG: hypothetical protein ABUS79_06105 [Pseudomonadota bacterium]